MTFILKLLARSAGPYIVSGVLLLLLSSSLTACVQGKRLDAAKADLRAARAALVNPLTKETWQAQALRADRDLATCKGNAAALEAEVKAGNEAVERFRAEGVRLTRAAEEGQRAARAASQRLGRQATAVLNATAGPDKCVSALALLRGKL